MEAVNVKTVAQGGKFCKCGGLMIIDDLNKLLLSDPPKVKIYCPFCAEHDYVTAPYNVVIQFKKEV